MSATVRTREETVERYAHAHALEEVFEVLLHPETFLGWPLIDLYPPELREAARRAQVSTLVSDVDELGKELWPGDDEHLTSEEYADTSRRAELLTAGVFLRIAANCERFADAAVRYTQMAQGVRP